MDADSAQVIHDWPGPNDGEVLAALASAARALSTPGTSSGLTSTSASASASASAPSEPATAAALPYDLGISNGTCYYAPGTPMDPGFIPCGNAASETKACCWKGDVCLGDRACFGVHEGIYTTYMGGCTDATDTLSNSLCPRKPAPYSDEPWIGLAYCNGTSDEWIACPQESSPASIHGAGPCACPAVTQQRIVAFRDASVLPSYASLPTAAGGSIKWLGGYTPTVGATGTAPSAATAATAATAASGVTRSADRHPQVALIIGLSVGLSGAVLLALAGILAFYRRRAQKEKQEKKESGMMEAMGGGEVALAETAVDLSPKATEGPQAAASTAVSELEIRPARPWSLRSELDGGSLCGAGGARASGEGPWHRQSGRASYGLLSPMTTGPSLAEALEVATQMTGRSSEAAAGQMENRRPPSGTLAELEG